jgi:hypothetical protein
MELLFEPLLLPEMCSNRMKRKSTHYQIAKMLREQDSQRGREGYIVAQQTPVITPYEWMVDDGRGAKSREVVCPSVSCDIMSSNRSNCC